MSKRAIIIIIGVLTCVLIGAQDAPNITTYRLITAEGVEMECAVLDWRFQLAMDCHWPQEGDDGDHN